MKKTYVFPELRLCTLREEDIITTSGGGTVTNITNSGSGAGMVESFDDFLGTLQ